MDTDRRLRPDGQVRPLVRQGIPRRRPRHRHPQGRRRGVPLPVRHASSGVGRQDDAQGRGGLEEGPPAGGRTSTRPARRATARPTSPSPPTAASTSATATARTTSTSTTRTPSGSAPGAATGNEPGKMQTPHGIWLDDRPGREPSLVVADRANARLQYFTLDGKHLGFVNDVLLPGPLRHPRRRAAGARPARPRHAVRQGQQGRSPTWATTRRGRKKVLDGFKMRADSRRSGRPASSSTRTTPASTRTATSSSSSGCRRDGSLS